MTHRNKKKLLGAIVGLLTGFTIQSSAQAMHQGDAAVTYQWVHSNAQPGDCGCFGLNGAGISASANVASRFAVAAEVSGGYEGRGSSTGNTLTLVSYMVGPRVYLNRHDSGSKRRLQPFGQVLVGAAHAGGGIAGAGDGTYAFAMRGGAGLDLRMAKNFSVRLVQADYYLTDFANTANDHQNNFLIGAGAVVRWSR